MEGWTGVDLDGTLAVYDAWVHHTVIGEPIAPMVERVKGWIAEGRDVRIFTARVAPALSEAWVVSECRTAIEDWCLEHLGKILPVTHEKDYAMVELWDDRCVQVVPNTGLTLREYEGW